MKQNFSCPSSDKRHKKMFKSSNHVNRKIVDMVSEKKLGTADCATAVDQRCLLIIP